MENDGPSITNQQKLSTKGIDYKSFQNKPGEIFFPGHNQDSSNQRHLIEDQVQNGDDQLTYNQEQFVQKEFNEYQIFKDTSKQNYDESFKIQKAINTIQLQKFQENLTYMIQEKLSTLTQEDLDYLIRRGIIDESQALLIFELFIDKTTQQLQSYYNLQRDYYVGGFIPLVYSLHFGFLMLAFAISMVHKHFSLRISLYAFLLFKLVEIIFFYLFALYLQKQECPIFSTIVHIIFDLTIYNLLLDILTFLEFKSEDFEFNVYTEGSKFNLHGKIVFNITLLAISYVSSIQFTPVLSSFFFFWYLGYLIFRLAVLLKESMPSFLQPFPYFCLSLFSIALFIVTLIFEEHTFRPPIPFLFNQSLNKSFNDSNKNYNQQNNNQQITFDVTIQPDFSFMSYISTLILFEITIFLYAFSLFYGIGNQTINLSHAELIQLRRSKMICYYEAVLQDINTFNMSQQQQEQFPLNNISNGNSDNNQEPNSNIRVQSKQNSSSLYSIFSFFVWTTLYGGNVCFIVIGFYKHVWIITIAGLYGIYEATWEFSKIYPNWFERKIILLSFYITLTTNSLMNFSQDQMLYKLYPLTKYSYYFYILIHYIIKSVALILLILVTSLEQHFPTIENLMEKSQEESNQNKEDQTSTAKDLQSSSVPSINIKKQQQQQQQKSSKQKSQNKLQDNLDQFEQNSQIKQQNFIIPSNFESCLKVIELLIEITIGIYILFVVTVVFAEQEQNLIFSFLYPLITSCFVMRNIYNYSQASKTDSIFQSSIPIGSSNEDKQGGSNAKLIQQSLTKTFAQITGRGLTTHEKKSKIFVGIYLFLVGIRISFVSSQGMYIAFFVSGIIMTMGIILVYESDNLYKVEILVVMFWLYFSHACLIQANSFFFFGLLSILIILNKFEKRHNKDGKTKTLPVVLFMLVLIVFFYIKDNFKFQTFFFIADGIFEQIIPPTAQIVIRNYYNNPNLAFEKIIAMNILESAKTVLRNFK